MIIIMMNNKQLIEEMEKSPLVKIREIENWLKSVNFTRDSFSDRTWNSLNTKARGLFIYKDNSIMWRSYNKFFNIGEFDNLEDIKNKAIFPITFWKKENGFLWIVSYNKLTNKLEYLSKATNIGEFADYVKEFVSPIEKYLLPILKDNNASAVFEIVDQERDAHIIPYKQSCFYLLDIFYNTIEETKLFEEDKLYDTYSDILEDMKKDNLSLKYPFYIKEKAAIIDNEKELNDFVIDRFLYSNNEGYVLEDSSKVKQQWKLKTFSYVFWKNFRWKIRLLKKLLMKEMHKQFDEEISLEIANDEYDNLFLKEILEKLDNWQIIFNNFVLGSDNINLETELNQKNKIRTELTNPLCLSEDLSNKIIDLFMNKMTKETDNFINHNTTLKDLKELKITKLFEEDKIKKTT